MIELIENGSPAYRAVYCAKYDTVFVLHAFTKTTNGVDRAAMKTVDERFKAMMKEVNARKKQRKI
ncbi:type II toxin-antitoxin system RelE/ParE family toxin [Rhizobium sp. RHZ02]|uniref:type II toxin-antitoxin system RelE/ParE family toxin n=1 Tax=Rhizobium sp. RHZ02 TaxID=2769306 RepID=UPI0028AAE0FF|nr:type II toxin-antitoxin system RelE/ParE family toxin [Rhizobium sp. RHZ02]